MVKNPVYCYKLECTGLHTRVLVQITVYCYKLECTGLHTSVLVQITVYSPQYFLLSILYPKTGRWIAATDSPSWGNDQREIPAEYLNRSREKYTAARYKKNPLHSTN